MDRSARGIFAIALTAIVSMIYIYPLRLSTVLLDPDEGLHASIAQEMVERGDYLVPRFLGKPFRDKPILYFAAQAASLRMFGMSEAAVRLPGELFGLLGCLTTAVLAWRLYGREMAAYALLAALTLVLPLMLTQSPAHDVALVPAINLLALCFWEQEFAERPSTRWRWLAGGAGCVALAILTKGLIGLALLAVGVGAFVVITRRLSWRLVGRCAFVLTLGAVLASPWFLIMERASPGYLSYYFLERHLRGYLAPSQYHGEEVWYYYAAPVLGGAMPWLLYAIATVVQLGRDGFRTRESQATLFLACWFFGAFIFLNASHAKLLTYSLPLFPPIAILAAVAFDRYFCGSLAPAVHGSVTAVFRCSCVFGLLGPVMTLWVFSRFLNAPSPPAAYFVALLASVVIGAALFLFERGRAQTAYLVGVIWFPLTFVSLLSWPLQDVAERHSQRSLARTIAAMDEPPEQLSLVLERIGSVMFYMPADKRNWFRAGRIREGRIEELNNLDQLTAGSLVAVPRRDCPASIRNAAIAESTATGRFLLLRSASKSVARQPQLDTNQK